MQTHNGIAYDRRRAVRRASALIFGLTTAAAVPANAQDGPTSARDSARSSATSDSAARATEAERTACKQFVSILEQVVGDSVRLFRQQGKLQRIVDDVYASYRKGEPLNLPIDLEAMPDSVQSLRNAAGPRCLSNNFGGLMALIQPELREAMRPKRTAADTVARSATDSTSKSAP